MPGLTMPATRPATTAPPYRPATPAEWEAYAERCITTDAGQDKRDRVKAMALGLMHQHGLFGRGWSFEWDGSRKQAGVCHYRTKVIRLSSPLMTLWPWDEAEDTVLHEIAHALTPGAKHGREWQLKAIELGARPVARYDARGLPMPESPPPRLIGYCPAGHKFFMQRMPKTPHSCDKCSNHYDERYLIRWQPNTNGERP